MEDLGNLHGWIRLTKTGASARRLHGLLEHFKEPAALFAAGPDAVARAAGCSVQSAAKLLDPGYNVTPRELELMRRLDVQLVTWNSPEYPALLRHVPDPPIALYVRGNLCPADEQAVALVGSRHATDYGKRVAERLARELVEAGFTVVSGMARGIDTAAHWGAVRGGGRTLACLGCGVDVAYPPENHHLAEEIARHGAVLSEYPMMCPPDGWHFPRRNRIVSGLSRGVVVIEAPARSGALITVECALDQNREVFAVPGNIDNARNRGAHALLRDGAKLVEGVEDILAELRPGHGRPQLSLALEPEPEPAPDLGPDELRVYQLLTGEPKPMDDLILEAELSAAKVGSLLTMLELKGVARRLPGNSYVRA